MKNVMICILTLVMMFLAGCGAEVLPDTYIEGSDYQYTQWSSGMFWPDLQQGDGVIYLFNNGFIYYIEDGTDVIMPLCNKADCLHDKETDSKMLGECNAFMGTYQDARSMFWGGVGIASCNGYIYCLDHAFSPNSPQTLHRCALDGTKKEVLYTWNSEESMILEWIIHRDVLYYVELRYYLEDDEMRKEISLMSLPLSGIHRRPETIYTADKDLKVLSLGSLQAYGNHIYFEIIASRSGEEHTASESNHYDRLFEGTYIFDLQNNSLSELTIPGLQPTAVILGVQFWQDRIVIDPYDIARGESARMPVYIAELDGSSPEVLFEDIPQADYFMSDGEYLYLFDDWMPDIDDWLSNPGLYTVYDEDMNIVDTFTAPHMPDGRGGRLPVGGEDWMYFKFQEDGENDAWGVMRWDKSGIGTYNGDAYEVEYIYR